jgi:hypothetical protein
LRIHGCAQPFVGVTAGHEEWLFRVVRKPHGAGYGPRRKLAALRRSFEGLGRLREDIVLFCTEC